MTKQYESLFKRYKDQPESAAFAFFPFDREAGENRESPFEFLAEHKAKKESWNFVRPEYRKGPMRFPILQSYLNYTFLRLQDLGRIFFTPDGKHAVFNTGLLTPDEKEIFALFAKNHSNRDGEIPDWFFKGFFDSYAPQIAPFRQSLPDVATYAKDASDYVLDTSFDIDVNIGHILDDDENKLRLPEILRNNRTLALAAIEGATKFLKQKVIRNYKIAIPQWYMPEKRIQLLLPLCLVSPEKADLALVADKDSDGRVYRIRTALRMDMAYSNARLITRPDRDWLDP